MATLNIADVNIKLHDIVTAALEKGFKVYAPHNETVRKAGFVVIYLEDNGPATILGVATHNWDLPTLSAPVKPNKVFGSGVTVDYGGTVPGALRAIQDTCESPMVVPRFVGNVPAVPNYGPHYLDKWPGGRERFAQVTL